MKWKKDSKKRNEGLENSVKEEEEVNEKKYSSRLFLQSRPPLNCLNSYIHLACIFLVFRV